MAKYVRKIKTPSIVKMVDNDSVLSDYIATGEWEEAKESDFKIAALTKSKPKPKAEEK
jgi:hypothetical protein